MDWPRAKSLLIFSFLALDLLLGGILWARQQDAYLPGFTSEFRQESLVKGELAREGITFLGHLPEKVPGRVRRLRVRVSHPDPLVLSQAFFSGQEEVTRMDLRGLGSGDNEGVVFHSRGERLTVLVDGLVLYERTDLSPGSLGPPLDPERARALAEEFLKRMGLTPGPADMVTPAPANGPPAYQVIYFQRYKGWPIFSAYQGLEVVSAGVRTFEQFLVAPVEFSGPMREIIPPEQALLRLKNLIGVQGGDKLVVEQIELGYYSRFDASARQWEAVPVWRVVMGGGQHFHINAYLGTLEE